MDPVNDLIPASKAGQSKKTDELFSAMYDDLCRLAGRFLQNEPMRNRLSSSSLVHQAYMRMVDQSRISWQGRTHFFAIGATVMRRILVDHARKVRSLKRGGDWQRRQLSDEVTFHLGDDGDVMMLDEMLTTLAELSPRQAKIVELRFFGGMTMKEISGETNIALRTVEKEWAMARAWMRSELSVTDDRGPSPTPAVDKFAAAAGDKSAAPTSAAPTSEKNADGAADRASENPSDGPVD